MTRTLTERFGMSFSERYAEYLERLTHWEDVAGRVMAWSGDDLRKRDRLLNDWVVASQRLEAAEVKIATAETRRNA